MARGPSGSSNQRGACRRMRGEARGRMSENASAPAFWALVSWAMPLRSISSTERPWATRCIATDRPMMPAPTTATSAIADSGVVAALMRLATSDQRRAESCGQKGIGRVGDQPRFGGDVGAAGDAGDDAVFGGLVAGLETAADHAFLHPGLARLKLAGRGQAGQLGAGAG